MYTAPLQTLTRRRSCPWKWLCGMYLARVRTECTRPIAFYVCAILYRNPSVWYELFHDLCRWQTISGMQIKPNASMLLLGFLIAFWVNSSWDSIVTLPNPTKLTESPTRIMQTIKMHSLRLVYLTWASVTTATSPVQNLLHLQRLNSKPTLCIVHTFPSSSSSSLSALNLIWLRKDQSEQCWRLLELQVTTPSSLFLSLSISLSPLNLVVWLSFRTNVKGYSNCTWLHLPSVSLCAYVCVCVSMCLSVSLCLSLSLPLRGIWLCTYHLEQLSLKAVRTVSEVLGLSLWVGSCLF